jgi:hypothetical protein
MSAAKIEQAECEIATPVERRGQLGEKLSGQIASGVLAGKAAHARAAAASHPPVHAAQRSAVRRQEPTPPARLGRADVSKIPEVGKRHKIPNHRHLILRAVELNACPSQSLH